MTKKEYKKKCKQEKHISYKLSLAGAIVSIIGGGVVILTMTLVTGISNQIFGFTIGGVIALIGMILDIIGEIILAKNYKLNK